MYVFHQIKSIISPLDMYNSLNRNQNPLDMYTALFFFIYR